MSKDVQLQQQQKKLSNSTSYPSKNISENGNISPVEDDYIVIIGTTSSVSTIFHQLAEI